MCNGFVL